MKFANHPHIRTRQSQRICAYWNDFGRKGDVLVTVVAMGSRRPAVDWLPDRACSG